MGHGFVTKFVGDYIVQNKESSEAGVLFCTKKPLPKPLGGEPGLPVSLDDGSSVTSSLSFGSSSDEQARALPSSPLLHHHPTNGSDCLRGTEYPSSKAQINFQKRFELHHAQSL